jgi:hypothetical protein
VPDDPSIDLIRQRMARIRMRAQGKADRLGEETRQFLDWKHYIRLFPWSTLAAAVVVGYVLVPRRGSLSRPTANALLEMAKENSEAVKAARQPPPAAPKTGLFDGLVSIAGNALLKSGLSFATQIAMKAVMHALSGDQATHPAPEEREIPRHDYV